MTASKNHAHDLQCKYAANLEFTDSAFLQVANMQL